MSILPVICFAISLILLLLFVHPFISYPLSLVVLRRFFGRQETTFTVQQLSYSVVFCAYNEEGVLPQKLDNLLAMQRKYGKDRLQILGYSDASTDRTNEILSRGLSEADGNLFLAGTVRRGKSGGMNQLLERATNEIVIFTDANVLIDETILDALDQCFSNPEVGVSCGNLIYVNDATATADVGTKYWRLEETIKQLETDTGSAMGADGSLFAIRRALYSPVPEDIIDDFCTSMRILCAGQRVVRMAKAVAYERSTDKVSDENKRKVRIACRAMNCHRFLSPQLRRLSLFNKYKYYSHKWLRWHAGFWMFGAVVFGFLGLLSIHFLTACLFAGLLIAGAIVARLGYAFDVPVVSKIWVILSSLFYTALGTLHSRMGKRYQTWTPPGSAR